MTHRLHFFPRLDVRDVPKPAGRNPSVVSTWRQEWREACARAAKVREIPSRYSGIERKAKSAGLDEVVSERRRKGEVFEA